jgi:hypothetical protein
VFLLGMVPWLLLRRRSLPRTKGRADGLSVWVAVGSFLVVGTLGGAILHPGKIPWGIAHSAIFPTAILLVGLAWGLLSRAPLWAALAVCCGMAVEFLAMFWWHWWLLFHDPEVLQPGAGEKGPREAWEPLLNQLLGRGEWLFLAGAVAVQAALIVLLWLSVRRRAEPVPEESQ